MDHVRLNTDRIGGPAARAAAAVADAGGSPRAQIDAARAMSSQRLGYLPHTGARQKARALARAIKAAEKQGEHMADEMMAEPHPNAA